MSKFLASVFILLSFVSCGVDTSSSTQTAKVEESTGTDTATDSLTPPPLVELNPIADANSTVPDDGTIDPGDGTVDPGDGTVDPGDGNTVADQSTSSFDVDGAVEDAYACFLGDNNNGYTNNVITDTSTDYLGNIDEEDGVGVSSRYPYQSDEAKTEVALFYYDLQIARSMYMVSDFQDDYTISIDSAWADNEKSVLYVKTPKGGNDLYECYRYNVSLIDQNDQITITKVYRIDK